MLPLVVALTTSPPRVLFLNSALELGADVWVHQLLLRGLLEAGYDVRAAAQPSPSAQPSCAFEALQSIPNLVLRETHFGPSLYQLSRLQKLKSATQSAPALASLFGLAHYIRREGIQILHSTDRPRDAIACAGLAKLTGAKAVIHLHVEYHTAMSRGVRWAFGQADAMVGVSQFVADSLVAGGYRPERVFVALNAIEPSKWEPATDPAHGRKSLGVPADAPLILSIGRLFMGKGYRELIRALALVKRDLPDARLAIVGSDYPPGSGTTAALQELAQSLGVTDSVLFTGQRQDISALLAASDVFALPSLGEPFGLVYAEAMAMKRPVIALRHGGAQEVVEHERSGLLAKPGDIEELAAHMLTLLRDPVLRARMGECGRAQVLARFTPLRLVQDVGALYARLMSADGLQPQRVSRA